MHDMRRLLLSCKGAKYSNIVRTLTLLLTIVSMGNSRVMASDLDSNSVSPGAFSLSWSGGLQYGSRKMTFDGDGKFYFAKGDTINDDPHTGVGVFALGLKNSDVLELNDVARALCRADIQSGGPETHDPAATFSVVCLDEGKAIRRSGSLRLIPERLRHQVFDAPFRLSDQARSDGQKIIKLDFSAVGIESKGDRYIVSVRFINSGTRWIRFKTPDMWDGTAIGGRLGVGAVGKLSQRGSIEESAKSWAFGLGGKKLVNRGEFPDGIVTLHPGQDKVLKIETTPDYRAEKGQYEFSGIAFMRIEYEGNGWGLSTQVDFKPIKSHITFDHDYPSTPQERDQWEATHRATMSSHPVNPGETFTEDGLYRAVRTTGGGAYRSLQLKPFKAGDIATTDNVKMLMATADGIELDGPVQWLWEGSAPTPVAQYSFDIVDETRQFCKPGAVCPRSGRWLPRVRESWNSTRYDLAGIVTLRYGHPMPAVKGASDDADWEWIGV